MKWLTLKGSDSPVLVYESLSMVLKWNSLPSTPLPWSPSHTSPPVSTVNLHDSWSDFGLACLSLVVCLLLHLCCLLPLRCLKFLYSWNGIWSGKSAAPLKRHTYQEGFKQSVLCQRKTLSLNTVCVSVCMCNFPLNVYTLPSSFWNLASFLKRPLRCVFFFF